MFYFSFWSQETPFFKKGTFRRIFRKRNLVVCTQTFVFCLYKNGRAHRAIASAERENKRVSFPFSLTPHSCASGQYFYFHTRGRQSRNKKIKKNTKCRYVNSLSTSWQQRQILITVEQKQYKNPEKCSAKQPKGLVHHGREITIKADNVPSRCTCNDIKVQNVTPQQ